MEKYLNFKPMTYQQAYNKIIDAYFKDEILPLDPRFCFCGTLCDNTDKWFGFTRRNHRNSHGYRGSDFVRMETVLLDTLDEEIGAVNTGHPLYEVTLFEAMCNTLIELKQIHIERGEVIDEVPEFIRRVLV